MNSNGARTRRASFSSEDDGFDIVSKDCKIGSITVMWAEECRCIIIDFEERTHISDVRAEIEKSTGLTFKKPPT